jgi:Fibronectin type III domain
LSFTIANKPSWAKFSSGTGKLSGTPAARDVGSYKRIVVAVTDGKATTALPAFSITVASEPASSIVSLSWVAPTENSDGTLLSNLKGYNVHYGTRSKTYSKVINVANPGLTDYVVQDLAAGTYYFSVAAYNTTGTESALSGEVAASVN